MRIVAWNNLNLKLKKPYEIILIVEIDFRWIAGGICQKSVVKSSRAFHSVH